MRVIETGLTCNNACVFCAQGDLSARAPEPRDVDVTTSRFVMEPGEVVAIQGGEPTLREDLPAIVRTIHARGARGIVLQTNGRRFAYRAYARVMREASDKLALDVSLHGSTEPMHDYHTQVPGSFRQTVLGMRHARAEGLELGVTTVVTRSNYRHLGDIVQVASGMGARAIHLAPAKELGRAARDSDRVIAPAELARPHVARALAEARRLGLGWLVDQRASDPFVHELFAGIGEVEPRPGSHPRSHARLPLFGSGSHHRRLRDIALEAVSDNGEQRQSQ